MPFKGQPVPTTTYRHGFFKVSDGKSVRVVVPPGSGDIKVGQICLFDGFLGIAVRGEVPVQNVKPGNALDNSDQSQELILTIEQAEYETDQIADTGDFKKGTQVYWDADAKVLTETAEGNRPVGRVTNGKDANGVIWFILGPQVNYTETEPAGD